MKQKIKFSEYSVIVTVVVLVLFVIGTFSVLDNTRDLVLFCIIMGGVTIMGLYYCPKYVEASEPDITLHRLIGATKVFPINKIQSVDTCYPSAGGLRLCGSGGYFGYWGYFSDIMIGTYFGYYGSRSYCFLVKLKDGKQYVIGCNNPVEMVDYIKLQMNK